MNKLITILTLLALTLPASTLAQPEEGRGERAERDRASQRERGDRPEGDRRSGDRERGDWRGKREPITVEQVDEAIATLREMHRDADPSWLQEIQTLAKEDAEKAAKRLSYIPRMHDMMHARKHKPEEFKLHIKQSRLMREFFPKMRELRQAQKNEDQAKIDELTPRLRESVKQLFLVRMEFKELEIKEIREKLASAEKELADIEADSEALVDEKMQEILSGRGHRGPREEGDRRERERRPVGEDRRPQSDRSDRDGRE
jgi:hypothetical protein